MRILLINYEYPPLGGGAGRATRALAQCFAQSGIEVGLLTSRYQDQPKTEKIAGINFFRFPVVRLYKEKSNIMEMTTFIISSVCLLARVVRDFHPQAIIAFFGIPGGPAAWAAKHFYQIPYIVSLRGGDVPGYTPRLKLQYGLLKPLIRQIWRQAGFVVANSQGLKELAQDTAPELEIRVIPNSVSLARFYPPSASREKSDRVRLVFAGRLVMEKGVDVLLDALAQLAREGVNNFHLQVAGDGPERPRLEEKSRRLGLGGRVTFAGWLSDEEIVRLYQNADLLVLPSLTEGMPNVLMEAMASGLPAVGTNVPGTREILVDGQTGLMVRRNDSEAYARALRTLLLDPQKRKRMGKAARREIAKYSHEAMAEAYLELVKKVINA